MDWKYWNDVAGTFGSVATILTLIVAIGALALAARQIKSASDVSREAGAMQAFRENIKLCFQEPQFSSTEMFQKAHPSIDLARLEEALTPETERYLWFLTILLSTCEEIATFVSARGKWRRILVLHVGFHAPAFRVLWPNWRKFYTDSVRAIVEEAIDKPSD